MDLNNLRQQLIFLKDNFSFGFFYKDKGADKVKAEKIKNLNVIYSQIKDHPFSDFEKNKIVFGVGDINSDLVFLGEGPGKDEDEQGKPFVGRAGKLLTKIINAMSFDREQVYITNVIKCRLENNRAPKPDEIDFDMSAITNEELKTINPKIICCLGASSMYSLLGFDRKISDSRGKFFDWNGIKVMPTYHPAYLLRNPSAKTIVWDDMQKILKELR